jgi:hypothetical protein
MAALHCTAELRQSYLPVAGPRRAPREFVDIDDAEP